MKLTNNKQIKASHSDKNSGHNIVQAKAEVTRCFCCTKPLCGPVGCGSANRATFANDESRPGSQQSPQDWHVISPFYYTALPLLPPASPFTLPLTQPSPHQANYLNCLGESNGRTFRPQCIVSRPYPQVLWAPQQRALRPIWGLRGGRE